MHAKPSPNPTKLVARIVRECLTQERFASLAELREAVKCACARYHVPYEGATVDAALTLVASNRPMLDAPVPPRRRRQAASAGDDRETARRRLAQIRHRCGVSTSAPRPMPDVRAVSPADGRRRTWTADRAKALGILVDEILETQQRCDALED